MRTPVVVASVWSSSAGELIASRLRAEGIDAYVRANFDRTTYGGEFGGASVFVDAEHRLEAELEIVRLEEADSGDDPDDPPRAIPRPAWVGVAGWLAVAALAISALAPPAAIVWRQLMG